jgi:hypothetical protein
MQPTIEEQYEKALQERYRLMVRHQMELKEATLKVKKLLNALEEQKNQLLNS